jgi:hypothetical protein
MKQKISYLLFGALMYSTLLECDSDSGINSIEQKQKTISVSYTIGVLGNPNNLLISKDGKKIYATNGSGLLEIGIAEKKVLKNYSLPNSRLESNDLSVDGKLISLSDFNSVYIADIENGMTFKKVIEGSAVYGSCIANETVYAPCFNDRIIRTYRLQDEKQLEINPYTGSSTVATPCGISYSMDRSYVVAIDETEKVLHIINSNNDSMQYHIPTGKTAKFTIPLKGDSIAAFCENSNQILFINIKEPEAVPVIIKIDSLEYADDAVYSISNNRVYIVLKKPAYYRDNGPFESGTYSLPELVVLDMNSKDVIMRGKIDVDASNLFTFSIALTPDEILLLITGSESIHLIEVSSLKI